MNLAPTRGHCRLGTCGCNGSCAVKGCLIDKDAFQKKGSTHDVDRDGTLPRSISTPSRDRLSGNLVDDVDDRALSMQQHMTVTRGTYNSAYGLTTFAIVF